MTTNTLPTCEGHSGQRTASPVEATLDLRSGTDVLLAVDLNILLSHCVGSVSFALTLLDELESSGRQLVDAIVRHAVNGAPLAAAEAAHSLRGTAGILGAELLREKAADIEVAGRDAAPSVLLGLVHDLCGEMDRCLASIPKLRSDLQRHVAFPN